VSHFVLLVWFSHLKDTSDSPLLLRFYNLQKICYTNNLPPMVVWRLVYVSQGNTLSLVMKVKFHTS